MVLSRTQCEGGRPRRQRRLLLTSGDTCPSLRWPPAARRDSSPRRRPAHHTAGVRRSPWRRRGDAAALTHLVSVAWQVHVQLARLDVPDFEGAVAAAADQQPAVCRPGHLVDRGHVAPQGHQVPGRAKTWLTAPPTGQLSELQFYDRLLISCSGKKRSCCDAIKSY